MTTHQNRPRHRNALGPGGNDVPPSCEEARAQRRATSMPFFWLVLAIVAILVFTVMMATMPAVRSSLKGQIAATATAISPPPQKQIAN